MVGRVPAQSPAFVSAVPLRVLTSPSVAASPRRSHRCPRCALAPIADAAGDASRDRVHRAADNGKVRRAERAKKNAAAVGERRREVEIKKKAEDKARREIEVRKKGAADAKTKKADAKSKAAAAETKAKVSGAEIKKKDAEAIAEAGKATTAEINRKVRGTGRGDASGDVRNSHGVGSGESISSGTDVGVDEKIVTDGGTVAEEEFFVASQDTPNVSGPPSPDGSPSVEMDGSVLGKTQASSDSGEALLVYDEDNQTSLFSESPGVGLNTFSANISDAATASVSPPEASTPSFTPEPIGTGRTRAGDKEGEKNLVVGERVREGVGTSNAGDVVGTPRFFFLRRVARAGDSARKDFSRVFSSEGSAEFPLALKLPSRRDLMRFAWEGILVVTLILLLQTGVSRTLRWIHNRLDTTRGTAKPSFPYEQSVFECMQRPLEFVSIFTVGTALAEAVSRPLAAAGLVRYIRTLRELGVIFAATWFLLRWIDRIRLRFAVDKRIDKAQVDATSRVATVVTTVIAILISLDTVGVNVQTVLAFGGIGGVAIGFAGREIISNFFGGFMIFLTRPFSVGEWIRSIEETELNGTVEDIGWYLTRVRTWDKRPLYIPNSRFSTLIVENPSRMSNRRILHTLHMRLEDMPVVTKVTDGIDKYLKENLELDPKQHRLAYVDSFDEFSVKIWVSCYTKSVFLFDWRRVQQDVLVAVYGIVRANGARLATMTTRDVRPGIDPDRYGPLGSIPTLLNQPASSPVNETVGVPDASWSTPLEVEDENLDDTLPPLVADIESGMANMIEDKVARVGVDMVPAGSIGVSSSGVDGGGTNIGQSTVDEDEMASVGVNREKGSVDSGVKSEGVPSSDSEGSEMLRGTSMPSNTVDALEMAAAAILAARNNQIRSDGRQNDANRPANDATIEVEESKDAEAPVVSASGVNGGGRSGENATPVAREDGQGSNEEKSVFGTAAAVAATAAAFAVNSVQSGGSSSGSGSGPGSGSGIGSGSGSGSGSGTRAGSEPGNVSGSESRSSNEANTSAGTHGVDGQQSGTMKISAAPKLGSSSPSGSSAPTSSASQPIPTGSSGMAVAGNPQAPKSSVSQSSQSPVSQSQFSHSKASQSQASQSQASQSKGSESKASRSKASQSQPSKSQLSQEQASPSLPSTSHPQSGAIDSNAPATSSKSSSSSKAASLTAPKSPPGSAAGKMNITAAPKSSKSSSPKSMSITTDESPNVSGTNSSGSTSNIDSSDD